MQIKKLSQAWDSEVFGGTVFNPIKSPKMVLLKGDTGQGEYNVRSNGLFDDLRSFGEFSCFYSIKNV